MNWQESSLPKPIQTLIEELGRLPGIGPKSAARLAFFLLQSPDNRVAGLARAIGELKEKIVYCENCYNITDIQPCRLCANPRRNSHQICVVSDPLDIVALERTHDFQGKYHVLHGEVSPINGVGPDNLRIRELGERLDRESIEELILATNPTMEGETTALYIAKRFFKSGLKMTRIARGLPVGGDLEYADQVTLSNALVNRREFTA